MEERIPYNANQKKVEVEIVISDKADFRTRKIIEDKEGHIT